MAPREVHGASRRLGFDRRVVGWCGEPPDLDQLQAQRLDAVQQAVERGLVLHRTVEYGLDRLDGGVRPSKAASNESLRRPLIRIS